jgi:cobalt-zinc-cadmium efflux system outer membrane protein
MDKKTSALLLALCSPGLAQTPSHPSPTYQDHRKPGTAVIEHDMPAMQPPNHPHMDSRAENSAPNAEQPPPVPELLKEVAGRPPMRLEQFQQLALAGNPTLPQANALVRQSSAQVRQAKLYPNPSVGYQGEQIRGGAFRGGEQGAFVQQTFVLGGKLGLRRDVFEQQRREDEIGVSEQRYRVLSHIGQSFYSALAAQEVVNVRKRLLSLAMDAVATAHQLANVGQADVPDVLQAEVEGEQAKVEYTTAQRVFLQAFQTLAALAGKPELHVSPLQGDLGHPPQIDSAQIVDQILRDSPAVKRAQQDINRGQAELKSAKRESIPDLQVRAGIQQNFEPINETTGTPVGLQGFATIGISLPIFNRNQGNVEAAKADLERAQSEVTRVQLSLRQSIQPLLQAYLADQAQAERYRKDMIPRASRAYELYLTKYQNMGAAYPQVLVSQRTYFQLQAEYINVLERLWLSAIALENFTLSSGLSQPMPSGTSSTTVNLPSSSGGSAQ